MSTGREDRQGRVLLEVARESLTEALGRGDSQDRAPDEPWLEKPGATFITLRKNGALRGCVGSLRAYRPLLDDVRSNVRAAAFSDDRFPPVQPDELPTLSVEVSLLSPSEPILFRDQKEALAALRPGVDGVIFEYQGRRSTFLPQVWEQLPDSRDFLAQLKLKAGLPATFWHPDVKLWRYTVSKWAEEDRA